MRASCRRRRGTSRSISLVPVLPTLPVTATMRALLRARAARPIASSAASESPTRSSAPSSAPRGSPWTPARPPPRFLKASPTKSCPSRSAFRATNTSPGAIVRVSMEKPVTRSRRRAVGAGLRRRDQLVPLPQRLGHASVGLRQHGAHHVVIRERNDRGAYDLAGFVALARHQQHVAGAEQARAGADGLGPVADLAALTARRPGSRRGSPGRPRCAGCRR